MGAPGAGISSQEGGSAQNCFFFGLTGESILQDPVDPSSGSPTCVDYFCPFIRFFKSYWDRTVGIAFFLSEVCVYSRHLFYSAKESSSSLWKMQV